MANKFYTFLIMCGGMAAGSTFVNRIMKPDMSIPKVEIPSSTEEAEAEIPAKTEEAELPKKADE